MGVHEDVDTGESEWVDGQDWKGINDWGRTDEWGHQLPDDVADDTSDSDSQSPLGPIPALAIESSEANSENSYNTTLNYFKTSYTITLENMT